MLINHWSIPDQLNPTNIPFLSIELSNRVSTVPADLLLKPIIAGLTTPTSAWLILALSSTLAENLTLLGSVGYLIVAEIAAHKKILSFWQHTVAGILITIFSFVVHFIWINLFIW